MSLVAQPKLISPTLHFTSLLIISFFVAIFITAFFQEIEIVAKGKGKVIPSTRIQLVQAEYPGRVKEIYVRNGDYVEKNRKLLDLDDTVASAILVKTQQEIERLLIEKYRINAINKIVSNISPDQSSFLRIELSQLSVTDSFSKSAFLAEQQALYADQALQIQQTLQRIDTQIETNIKSENVTRASIHSLTTTLDIQAERLKIHTVLVKKGAISKLSHLDSLEKHKSLTSKITVHERELDYKKSQNDTYRAERQNYLAELNSNHSQRKSEIEARLANLTEELKTNRRRVNNMSLLAPASGYVENIKVFTIGGIVERGEELMHIVPVTTNPELEIIFPNTDIGFIKPDQLASIKLDAFPAERFGHLKATVTTVATDAIETSKNKWGYIVHVRPLTPFLESGENQYKLRSGMTATVDVITGKRTLISYFFAPIVKAIADSLGER